MHDSAFSDERSGTHVALPFPRSRDREADEGKQFLIEPRIQEKVEGIHAQKTRRAGGRRRAWASENNNSVRINRYKQHPHINVHGSDIYYFVKLFDCKSGRDYAAINIRSCVMLILDVYCRSRHTLDKVVDKALM